MEFDLQGRAERRNSGLIVPRKDRDVMRHPFVTSFRGAWPGMGLCWPLPPHLSRSGFPLASFLASGYNSDMLTVGRKRKRLQ